MDRFGPGLILQGMELMHIIKERPDDFEQCPGSFCCRTVLFFSNLIAPGGYPNPASQKIMHHNPLTR